MNNETAAHHVRIHIDRQPYQSPNPTTGEALYHLGQITAHRELFREVGGDEEDQPVPRTGYAIRVKEDEHFYSEKAIIILMNGEPEQVTETKLSFDEVTKLAFPISPEGTCIEYTVSYRDGPAANPKGTLTAGHSVKLKNGMFFDVTATDRS